jgi:hypothetical protein
MKRNILSVVISIGFLVFIFSGCGYLKFNQPRSTSTISGISIPEATETNSLISPTVVSTATNILIPTLTSGEAISKIEDYIQNNDNCLFPCIWGLTPGNDANLASDLVTNLGDHPGSSTGISIYQDEKGGLMESMIYEEEVVKFIGFSYYQNEQGDSIRFLDLLVSLYQKTDQQPGYEVFGNSELYDQFEIYMVSHILEEYGTPKEIYIAVWPLDPMDQRANAPFTISLYYPKDSFIIQYVGLSEKQERFYNLDLRNVSMDVSTWEAQEQISLVDLYFTGYYHIGNWYPAHYKSLEEACGMTVDEFYHIYSNSNFIETLQTPKNIWDH